MPDNPVNAEIQSALMTYTSDSLLTSVHNMKQNYLVTVYPNPSNSNFTLYISSANQNSDVTYTVYNVLGNVLLLKGSTHSLDLKRKILI